MTIEAQQSLEEVRYLAGRKTKGAYDELDLLDLVGLIVKNADHRALDELHSRRKAIVLKDRRSLLLVEYLSLLKLQEQKLTGNYAKSIDLSERAYDLTLDKFMNLPTEPGQNGSDCRRYFRAFLAAVNRSLQGYPTESRLEREARSGAMLKSLVSRHFAYSIREAAREADEFWSRYQWQVNGRSLKLLMPSAMTGAERREWLQENIPLEFIGRSDARNLVQNYIEKNIVREHFVPLDALDNDPEISQSGFCFLKSEDWGFSLAEVVAQEKTINIDKLRSAISKIGPKNLATMIQQIFLDLDAEDYQQKRIAKQFGLSTATLSRFAGRKWKRNKKGKFQVPDLWRNTAQVISQSPVFLEAAKKSGMLDRMEEMRGGVHE